MNFMKRKHGTANEPGADGLQMGKGHKVTFLPVIEYFHRCTRISWSGCLAHCSTHMPCAARDHVPARHHIVWQSHNITF